MMEERIGLTGVVPQRGAPLTNNRCMWYWAPTNSGKAGWAFCSLCRPGHLAGTRRPGVTSDTGRPAFVDVDELLAFSHWGGDYS